MPDYFMLRYKAPLIYPQPTVTAPKCESKGYAFLWIQTQDMAGNDRCGRQSDFFGRLIGDY
jgi:hypothetical protein